MDEENLRRNLKSIIEEKNLNMKAVSLKAGLGETAVRDIIVGRTKSPTYKTIKAIADVIDCSVDILYSEELSISEIKSIFPQAVASSPINEELLEKCYEVIEQKAVELKVKLKKKELIKATIALYKIAVRDKAAGQDNISVGAALSIIENTKDSA